MFEYFNEDARKIVVGAQEQAKSLKQNFITVEHLFLAIVNLDVSPIVDSLIENEINIHELYDYVLESLTEWENSEDFKTPNSALPLTPSAKKTLELSANEAIQTQKQYVQGEHIFLGMLRLGEGIIIEWFKNKNIDVLKIRESIVNRLKLQEPSVLSETDESKNNVESSKILDAFCINMTEVASKGGFDPVIGREQEVSRLTRILARRTKNNPVLTGEPGIGKTAIVEALAQRIIKGNVPAQLKNKIIYNLNMGAVVAGTRYRGELEERIDKIIKELKSNNNIILFIDEIHTIMGAGDTTESSMNIANQLKPALSRGEVRIIGATTAKEYRRYIEKDAALERRFQPVNVKPPTLEETLLILKGLRDKYEAFHKVTITDEALEAAIYFADRFISERYFPDKAIDLIDEAAAKVKLSTITEDESDFMLDSQIQEAIRQGDFVEAARLRQIQNETVEAKDEESEEDKETPIISKENIASIVAEITGIPAYKISDQESSRLKFIEKELSSKIIGQPEAVKSVAKAIKRMRTGIRDINKPISMIFAGSTGTGKTELAKTLAEYMFDDKSNFVTIDMSEYSEQHTASRLFGAPPGYVGYESGGQLTEHVYRKPYSVVLFDEIEKAHPNIFNTLLQILDEGRMTDGQGRVINFKNTIIILTTNLGGEELNRTSLGFTSANAEETKTYEESKKILNNILKKNFKPEFLNRIDEIVVFHKLTIENLTAIIDNMIKVLNERLFTLGYNVELTQEAKVFISERGYNSEQGARPLARAVQTHIEDVIGEMIIDNTLKQGETIIVEAVNDELIFSKKNGAKVKIEVNDK